MKLYRDDDDTSMIDEDNDSGFTTDLADPTITEEDLRWAYPELHLEGEEGDEDEEVV